MLILKPNPIKLIISLFAGLLSLYYLPLLWKSIAYKGMWCAGLMLEKGQCKFHNLYGLCSYDCHTNLFFYIFQLASTILIPTIVTYVLVSAIENKIKK